MASSADREELRALLLADGILRASETQPLVSRDGKTARWMLDSLRVSMTPRGAELAGRLLCEQLEKFEARQIATYGTIGIPLLQSCVMSSGGRYRGILVRKERKKHGSLKLIEGPIDPDEPVIILDDSVSSGLSMFQCIEKLEEAGFRIEGGVCLVRFGWQGGYGKLRERGFHMETVFDAYRDLAPTIDGLVMPANPSRIVPKVTWATEAAADGMTPPALARLTMERFLRGEPIPLPPRELDGVHDSAGGAWVSVRSKANIHQRHAREGFWCFPGEERSSTAEDVIRAALRTATKLAPDGIQKLDSSAIAVTFFGALEQVPPRGLDNDCYGIVVCSRERDGKMGGALPRMPGFTREWAQFEHARRRNGQLVSFEPFALFRHDVTKVVEAGVEWQPTGVPYAGPPAWAVDPAVAGRVAARAYDVARARFTGSAERTEALPAGLLPAVDSLFVTILHGGHIRGCFGGKLHALDDDLRRAAAQALVDPRFASRAERAGELHVTVSFLSNPTALGQLTPEEVAPRVRHGEQALLCFQGARRGVMLPFVVLQQGLSPAQYVAEVIDKAGVTRAPYSWGRWDCDTWLAGAGGQVRLVHGMPPGEPPATLDAAIERLRPLLLGYLLRHQRADGLLNGYYRPFLDRVNPELDMPRQAYGVWTLARAHRVLGGLDAAAKAAVDAIVPRVAVGVEQPIAEQTMLLLALCERARAEDDALAGALADQLWRRIDCHGRIATHPDAPGLTKEEAAQREALQDYFPGQALLALGVAVAQGRTAAQPERHDRAERAIRHYRHRFRYKRSWAQVCWLPQAAAAWYRVTRDPALAALAFEVADWALDYQLDKSGGFVNELQPDSPGYTTAVFIEGVVAALGCARAVDDAARVARYQRSCLRGLQFLDGLIYQERDRPLLPNPELAFGGLRVSRTAGDVRIDFVHHALNAVIGLLPDA